MAGINDLIKAGAKVVDVRSTDEYADEHFNGALNIPVDQIQSRLDEIGDKTAPVVLYCASGARSAFATRILKAAGFTNVTNAGGLYDMPGF